MRADRLADPSWASWCGGSHDGAGPMYDCDRHRPLHGAHGPRHQGRLWGGDHARTCPRCATCRRPRTMDTTRARSGIGAWRRLAFGVVFSCLATHATVTTAISLIERTGTGKMEGADECENRAGVDRATTGSSDDRHYFANFHHSRKKFNQLAVGWYCCL